MLSKFKWGVTFFMVSLLALIGCQSEKMVDDMGSQTGQTVTLIAKHASGSRTAIKDVETEWVVGDKIYVSSRDGDARGTLTCTEIDASTGNGTFKGQIMGSSADLAYSVYPAPVNGKTLNLAGTTGAQYPNAPMIGKISEGNITFENTCGVLYLNLNGVQGKTLEISAFNGDTPISLAAKADVTNCWPVGDDYAKPALSFENPSKTIKIYNAHGGEMYVPFYIANCKGLDNVIFKVGTQVLNKEGGIDLSSGIVGKLVKNNIATFTLSENGKYYKEVENTVTTGEDNKTTASSTIAATDFNQGTDSSAETVTYFTVSASYTSPTSGTEGETSETKIADKVAVTLPKVNSDNQAAEIAFTDVDANTSIVIEEVKDSGNGNEGESDTSEPDNSIKELTVVIPSNITAEQAQQTVTITMPNTTVTVKSADGQILKIGNMEAATADHTLVIGENVEVGNLLVKEGNVEVHGEITGSITRDDNNPDVKTIITLCGQGEVNLDNLDENVIVQSDNKEIFQGAVSNYAELVEALKYKTAIIAIANGFEITGPLRVTGTAEIYMKNNTFTINSSIEKGAIEITGSLKIVGGTITSSSTENYFLLNEGICTIENATISGTINNIGGTLLIQSGHITGNFMNQQHGKIQINAGTIIGNLQNNAPELANWNAVITIAPGVTPQGSGWSPYLNSDSEMKILEGETIEFPNVAFHEALFELWGDEFVGIDNEGKRVISKSKAETVTAIEFSNLTQKVIAIKNLVGIEKFPLLTTFVIPSSKDNSTPQIEAADFSNNVKMTKISIPAGNLSVLNVKNLSSLRELNCGENSELLSLNLEGCTSLTNLVVAGTSISSLNIPATLTHLYCDRTGISSLNLANCSALTGLQAYSCANLSFLTLPNNASPLQNLHIEHTKISGSLDLSRFTSLKYLCCFDCQLTSLNLSGCKNLTELKCGLQGPHKQAGDNQPITVSLPSSLKSTWENTWSGLDQNKGATASFK